MRSDGNEAFLRRLDARLKILLLMAACFVTQYLPDELILSWLAALAWLFVTREMRSARIRGMLRGAVAFVLFWVAMKTVSDVIGGMNIIDALAGAAPIGGRLAALSLIGMGFTALSSPVEIGRAVAWYLRFLIGDRAWKPALAVALTAWFLPQTLRLAGQARASIQSRGLKLSWWKRVYVVVGTALRILDGKASELAVALASRRLDDGLAWRWR